MHFIFRIQLETQKVWFVSEKFEKNLIFQFWIKIKDDQLSLRSNFSNVSKEIPKLTSSDLVKMFVIKSHQRRTLHLVSDRNGRS